LSIDLEDLSKDIETLTLHKTKLTALENMIKDEEFYNKNEENFDSVKDSIEKFVEENFDHSYGNDLLGWYEVLENEWQQ